MPPTRDTGVKLKLFFLSVFSEMELTRLLDGRPRLSCRCASSSASVPRPRQKHAQRSTRLPKQLASLRAVFPLAMCSAKSLKTIGALIMGGTARMTCLYSKRRVQRR